MTAIRKRDLLLGAAAMAASSLVVPRARSALIAASPNTTGVQMITLANGHKVWTQRLGRSRKKVLILHGGPGLSHEYMQCFADVLPAAGYELHFYDQLGCGQSDRPKDAALWTLPRYLREVDEVCSALGLDRAVLIGHSWGGILGLEFALRFPDRLSGLVVSNMTASFADYNEYLRHLRDTLPDAVRTRLAQLEWAGDQGGAEYSEIITRELYSRYTCRLKTWPQPLLRCLSGLNTDIYQQMQGPEEFTATGNLRNWDRWDSLRSIRTPTLVMGARYDEMNPASIRREARLIPDAKLFISQTGSHLSMWDDQTGYFKALIDFLTTVAFSPN